uniref:Uncharacterized protein n=1 Tax=Nelumbo nucifera TaxID=4432 RepID=A0A822ZJ44_NELNU|nr:TPA_asm: hypothetical protein HUJ06_001881 [Nelumbo nucifera]
MEGYLGEIIHAVMWIFGRSKLEGYFKIEAEVKRHSEGILALAFFWMLTNRCFMGISYGDLDTNFEIFSFCPSDQLHSSPNLP